MNLNTELINRTEVLMPPTVKEQTAIEAKLIKVRQVKQGMMYELLMGRIRLVYPNCHCEEGVLADKAISLYPEDISVVM